MAFSSEIVYSFIIKILLYFYKTNDVETNYNKVVKSNLNY